MKQATSPPVGACGVSKDEFRDGHQQKHDSVCKVEKAACPQCCREEFTSWKPSPCSSGHWKAGLDSSHLQLPVKGTG